MVARSYLGVSLCFYPLPVLVSSFFHLSLPPTSLQTSPFYLFEMSNFLFHIFPAMVVREKKEPGDDGSKLLSAFRLFISAILPHCEKATPINSCLCFFYNALKTKTSEQTKTLRDRIHRPYYNLVSVWRHSSVVKNMLKS